MELASTPGVLALACLKHPRPEGFDLYVAGVRKKSQPLPGWKWSPALADLGPPLELLTMYRTWRAAGEWPRRWPEYEELYLTWMEKAPCAHLLTLLERRIRGGQRVVLGCWCPTPLHCHRGIIGQEFCRRGVDVLWEASGTDLALFRADMTQ